MGAGASQRNMTGGDERDGNSDNGQKHGATARGK